jgi:hypothetical protein
MSSLVFRNRTLIAICLAGLLGGGVAMAQTSPASAQNDAGQAPVVDQAQEADAQAETKKAIEQRKCLQYTGSRIRSHDATGKRSCVAGPGSVYSRDDIDSTGQTDLAGALQRLDPSISGH